MGTRTRCIRAATLPALAATFLVSAGCSQAVRTALGLAGVDSKEPADRAMPDRSAREGTSTYEHTPPLEWLAFSAGQPWVPSLVFLDAPGPRNCALAPHGVSRVLPVPEGAPARPLQRLGPFELGMAGVTALEVERLYAAGSADLAWRMMERTSRLSTRGEGCGFSAFLYVAAAGTSSTEPVMVNRE